MAVVGALMLRARPRAGTHTRDDARDNTQSLSIKLVAVALAVGVLSGFFGIGGGFLIVPGLLFATGMPMIAAVGTSLLAVGALGLATALNYALSGMIDWPIALEYILGGFVGGWLGTLLSCRLAEYKGVLTRIFAVLIFAVAAYMLYRTGSTWIVAA